MDRGLGELGRVGDNRLGILLRGRLGVNLIRSGGGGLYYYGMRFGMKRRVEVKLISRREGEKRQACGKSDSVLSINVRLGWVSFIFVFLSLFES